MLRLLFLVLPALVLVASPLAAQVAYRITPMSGQLDEPDGGFSVGIRVVGRTKVTFGNLGTIDSPYAAIDTTSEQLRQYDDGGVGFDTRSTDDGVDQPDDGRTNNWNYNYTSQVTADQSAIMFHRQSSVSDGSTVGAESGEKPGVDIEYALRLGGMGTRRTDGSRPVTWGVMSGLGFSDINAKTRGVVSAMVTTLTDTYSLDGAPVPPHPYTAPSSEAITVVDADGNSTTYSIDTSVLLANKPYSRTQTTEAGEIMGFWQVKGVSASVRAGPWLRWRPDPRWSLKLAVGATYSYVGLEMRYDELINSEEVIAFVRDSDAIEPQKYSAFGYYGAIDAELWLTARTAFFGSFVYERASLNKQITVGGRTADVNLSGGTGFRFGITTLF